MSVADILLGSRDSFIAHEAIRGPPLVKYARTHTNRMEKVRKSKPVPTDPNWTTFDPHPTS
jgi:hypothetical protein